MPTPSAGSPSFTSPIVNERKLADDDHIDAVVSDDDVGSVSSDDRGLPAHDRRFPHQNAASK